MTLFDDQYDDCPDCVYGTEFIDDGIPCRIVTTMCARCKKECEAMVEHLLADIDAAVARQRQGNEP